MINIELYINGELTDTGRDFSVRLNRQLINPAELNTKDAQFSYSVSLPPTPNNNKAFNFANVEEVKGKFNREYKAQLIINSVRIFVGNFRLSEVSAKGYKGNLYIPAVKSIKDIFGDTMLNQNPEYRIPFSDFVNSINANNATPQAAIFPYVLYGLLPKVPLDKNANNYSPRNVWDNSVRIGMQDLPPSINVLYMLKHIFNSNGYELQGSAFNDDRLTRLYMSYKNPTDYVQPWNYGYHAKVKLNGAWSSTRNKRAGDAFQFERGVNQSSDGYNIYSADIFDAVNSRINVQEDPGGNVLYKEVNDGDNVTWAQTQLKVPSSGFYKVRFGASIRIYDNNNWRDTDPKTGVQHVSGDSSKRDNKLWNMVTEVRLVRDRKAGDFGLQSAKIDGQMYYNNQPQNQIWDENNVPKHFPTVNGDGQINFVDLAQDRNVLLGFSFGGRDGDSAIRNPRNGDIMAQMLVAKPALSWDTAEVDTPPNRLAINAPGYQKWGRIGNFDSEDENPDKDLDFSGGDFQTGKVLDYKGDAVTPEGGTLLARLPNFYASYMALGGLFNDPDYETTDLIRLKDYNALKVSATVDPKDGLSFVAYYAEGFYYLANSINAPMEGEDAESATYSDFDILANAPAEAYYIRVSNKKANGFTLVGDPKTNDNIILNKFPLQNHYTYRLTLSGEYNEKVFLHDADNPSYRREYTATGGVVEFNITDVTRPLLTLYLRTADFDISQTLRIDRLIEAGSEDVIGWEATDKYHITLNNAPRNYAKRGQFNGQPASDAWYGQGDLSAVIWLEAGELLSVASISSEGGYRRSGMHSTFGWVNQEVLFNLEIEPFRVDPDWLKVSYNGTGTAAMNWNDTPNFDTNSINLTGFLPSDMKTNDFIDNLVKAFNLRLVQTSAGKFSLDVKQSKAAVTTRYINLDEVASVKDRGNSALGLPSLYKIGFTVNQDEEGYQETKDDGGGEFSTGAIEESIVEQKSSFSYNWFKRITQGAKTLELPIISKAEAWKVSTPYPEAMAKRYTDLALRFWYYDGLLDGVFKFNDRDIKLAKVSEALAGKSVLNYKNKDKTILSNYFTVLINSSSHYTDFEAYLTPEQYEKLDGSLMALFNGDLYYVAQLEGYDPTARNKTKIKLIRKI